MAQEVTALIHSHNIREIRQHLSKYLRNKNEVWILFDNLDKGWTTQGLMDGDITILRCLLDAAKKIQREMNREGHDFYVVVFIRNDVYQLLMQESADWMNLTHLNGAEGLFSNIDDLAKWADAYFGGRIISKESLHSVLSPVTLNSDEVADFGLGWYLEEIEGEKVVSHGGGIFGFVCHTLYLPESQIYVAVLNNLIDPTRVPSTKILAEYAACGHLGK